MSEEPQTDRRVVVRVLLRKAGQKGEPAMVQRLGDYVAYVVGEATKERWPGTTISNGDMEAIVWTTARQATAVVRNLMGCAGVLDARADDGTATKSVPLGRTR